MFGPDEAAGIVEGGGRLTSGQALSLLGHEDLPGLGAAAAGVRGRLHPGARVTFVVDSNPNYTNVCVSGCAFCAFHRPPGHPEAYTHTIDQVMEAVGRAAAEGATTVLLQGGLNPDLPLGYYLDLVRETRRRFPGVTPHFFSAPEVVHMAGTAGVTVAEVIGRLRAAGQVSLPGGGAEILEDGVRSRLSPGKCTADEWIAVHREAHAAGMRSTATMMYGHIEADAAIVEHLGRVRGLQDETGGFTAFVAWSFKTGGSPLGGRVPRRAGPCRYLRITAVARLFLDNVPHVQASWFGEGKPAGQVALHFGADDFGGTLFEENVHREARHVSRASVDEVVRLIREAGFLPVQRDTLYGEIGVRAPDGASPEDEEGADG